MMNNPLFFLLASILKTQFIWKLLWNDFGPNFCSTTTAESLPFSNFTFFDGSRKSFRGFGKGIDDKISALGQMSLSYILTKIKIKEKLLITIDWKWMIHKIFSRKK